MTAMEAQRKVAVGDAGLMVCGIASVEMAVARVSPRILPRTVLAQDAQSRTLEFGQSAAPCSWL